jgi:glucokinase-like ROK family protein
MNSFRTGNQGSLRQQNLSGIMHYLYENAPISRTELATLTGLNKTTVSSLINELLENQFVREIGIDQPNTAGRRSVLLNVNPSRGCILSGEIGVDFISIICADFAAEIVWRHREEVKLPSSQSEIINRTLDLLKRGAEYGESKVGPLLGLTVAVPGLVDWRSGYLIIAPNLGWQDVPLRDILEENFQTQVFLDNDVTLAALGEQYFGAAEGHSEVLYISVGVGLGGGLVLEGQLYNGSAGFAAEVGHMTMDPDGEDCKCGSRGCWETQISEWALFRYIKQSVEAGDSTVLMEMTGGDLQNLRVPMVVEAARANDAVALQAFEKIGRYMGIGFGSLVNVLNPDLIVFGGPLSVASDYILETLLREMKSRTLCWKVQQTEVVVSRFGPNATVMGGIAKVYREVLANPVVTEQESRAVTQAQNGLRT